MGCGSSSSSLNANPPAPAQKHAVPEKDSASRAGRTFPPSEAHGGEEIEAPTTALVMIEYQNEFTSEGGKLYDGVKGVMENTNMLQKSVEACASAREKGVRVFHVQISFKEDGSDNPNKNIGILKGCADGKLFTEGTWNAAICDQMAPKE